MNRNTVDDWLGAARDAVGAKAPDAVVESNLLARVRERQALQSVARTRAVAAAHKGAPWWQRLAVAAPLAVAAAVATLLAVRMLVPPGAHAPVAGEIATPFIALVAAEAIAAERSPVVVKSGVSRAALADYGLPVDPARADEPVNAELLMSRTGVVLAVRFME